MNKTNLSLGATTFAMALFLANCGGGAGSNPLPPSGGGPTPTPTPTSTAPASGATTATITVVDDQNGAPLASVPVKLYPWTVACSTPTPTSVSCSTPLPAPQPTTDAAGHATLANVPNADYLLVIGSDSKSDTTRATIHDHVKFTGGTVAYAAPSPVPVPLVTPNVWETNGDYRLAAIDQTSEFPCFTDFNALRMNAGLPTLVFDEWLMENAREIALMHEKPAYTPGLTAPGNPWGYLTTGNDFLSGGSSCASMTTSIVFNATAPYSTDARTLWFGGKWVSYAGGTQAVGIIEFPIDPRAVADPNALAWP